MDRTVGEKTGYGAASKLLPRTGQTKRETKTPGRALLGGRTEFSWGHTRVRACKRLPELRRGCVHLSSLGLLEVPQRVVPRENGVGS